MDGGVTAKPIESQLPGQPPNPHYSGLSGPYYSVTGHAEKFKLPPVKVLKPGVEHYSGHLESWPAHPLRLAHSNLSFGRNTPTKPSSQAHTKHLLTNHNAEKKPISPKPKFLVQLEAYLNKELRLLGCPPFGPHELRLQAHREVFEYLIEDFKTYKGLLSAIKNEYELYLEFQDEVIKELKPLRVLLKTVREECDRKILEIKDEERREESGVQQENKRLLAVIDKMREEELSYKAQIEKLQAEVGELFRKYQYESDARKMLVSDYNDLKFRQQEQKPDDDGFSEEREDPVVLKLKLVRAREDLRISNQRINTMLADYGDVIPRREFEAMESSYSNLEAELESVKGDHTALMAEHNTLQSLYNEAKSQKDKLIDEITNLKRSATPRPDWSRCGLYIEGGDKRWAELSEGRSSDRMLDILLAQITGKDESEVVNDEPFVGKGMDCNVPYYLRAEGSVKNRRIPIKALNQLINGFWHHRLTTTQDPPIPHDEDLFQFLLTRNNHDEVLAIEDGYNLHNALSRFGHESYVSLFKKTIEGEMEEDLFRHWLHYQTTLTEAFSQQQIGQGVISADLVPKILESMLPGKPEQHLKELNDLATQLATKSPGVISFIDLLSPDKNGRPNSFSLMLLEQYLKEIEQFVEEIAKEIAGQETLSANELQTVLQKLDPSMTYEDQLVLLAKAFSVSLEAVSEDRSGLWEITTPADKLLDQLKRNGAHRSGVGE